MRKRLNSSLPCNSGVKFTRLGKPFIDSIDDKFPLASNLFNNSNDSIINNTNNDLVDDVGKLDKFLRERKKIYKKEGYEVDDKRS